MPKIIENLEQRLVCEARRQIEEFGYGATTIRSVASACGVGVGTVYNYFSSKDELIATYMLSDWRECLSRIEAVSTQSNVPEQVAHSIWEQLQTFSRRNRTLFRDKAASASFQGAFSAYHSMLRRQLAEPLRKFCESDFAAEFVAEALLTWTTAGKPFDEIYGMIGKIF